MATTIRISSDSLDKVEEIAEQYELDVSHKSIADKAIEKMHEDVVGDNDES